RSVDRTSASLGRDGEAYERLINPIVEHWSQLESTVLGPPRWPDHPLAVARFGLRALRPVDGLTRAVFAEEPARALLAGMAAYGMLPLDFALTSGFGLVLAGMAHLVGWQIPRGGAQSITKALSDHLRSLGGEIVVNSRVTSLDKLPPAGAILCDLSPRPF